MACELCGKEGILYKALIEGTELVVCEKCGRFGKILKKFEPQVKKEGILTVGVRKEPIPEETGEVIVEEYGRKIKEKRESLGLMQKELALKIAEKDSLVHKIESEKVEPSIPVARKLERFLKIKLIETADGKELEKAPAVKKEQFTIGDFIKVR